MTLPEMGGLLRALEQLPACRQRWFARATASQGKKTNPEEFFKSRRKSERTRWWTWDIWKGKSCSWFTGLAVQIWRTQRKGCGLLRCLRQTTVWREESSGYAISWKEEVCQNSIRWYISISANCFRLMMEPDRREPVHWWCRMMIVWQHSCRKDKNYE